MNAEQEKMRAKLLANVIYTFPFPSNYPFKLFDPNENKVITESGRKLIRGIKGKIDECEKVSK